MSKQLFALVDCNSFYCSCERLFRPELEGKPIAVLSNGDGAIVSRTDELKAMGIGKMSEPYFKVKDLFKKNNVHVFSSNYALYADMSRRVMQTLNEFTPNMEVYSIDEAFLSLKGFEHKNILKYASEIRDTVKKHTGIPVSIGVAPTKVLAKVANNIAKKNKFKTNCVFSLIDKVDQDKFLKNFPVKDIWGIGGKSEAKLHALKIFTAHDLREANAYTIQKTLTIVGRRILDELKGISCIDLQQIEADKKQIISSRSFENYVTNIDKIRESIATHVTDAAQKLRKQGLITKNILVFIQTNPYSAVHRDQYYNSASMKILSGTSHTGKLIKYALNCLDQIYKEGFYYKKAGIILNDFQKKYDSQLDLFSTHDTLAEDSIMKTIDLVNLSDGKNTVKYATCGTDKKWDIQFKLKSPNYTTRWGELLSVR